MPDAKSTCQGAPWAKCPFSQYSYTQSMVETEEPQRQLPQLPPIPRGKGPSVSYPELIPWIPASFLLGALPTACGGSPGNTPCFCRPTGLVDKEGAHRLQTVPRFSGRLPEIRRCRGHRKVRNGIPRWFTQCGPENGVATSSKPWEEKQ